MRVYEQQRPWQSNAERLVSEALAASQTPADVLAQLRPPLPQIIPFPPRFGYGTVQERMPSIWSVLDVARLYGDNKDDISGGPGGYEAASRNVTSDGGW